MKAVCERANELAEKQIPPIECLQIMINLLNGFLIEFKAIPPQKDKS